MYSKKVDSIYYYKLWIFYKHVLEMFIETIHWDYFVVYYSSNYSLVRPEAKGKVNFSIIGGRGVFHSLGVCLNDIWQYKNLSIVFISNTISYSTVYQYHTNLPIVANVSFPGDFLLDTYTY